MTRRSSRSSPRSTSRSAGGRSAGFRSRPRSASRRQSSSPSGPSSGTRPSWRRAGTRPTSSRWASSSWRSVWRWVAIHAAPRRGRMPDDPAESTAPPRPRRRPTLAVEPRQFAAGLLFGLACTARLTIVFGAPFFVLVGAGGTTWRRGWSAGARCGDPARRLARLYGRVDRSSLQSRLRLSLSARDQRLPGARLPRRLGPRGPPLRAAEPRRRPVRRSRAAADDGWRQPRRLHDARSARCPALFVVSSTFGARSLFRAIPG